MKSKTDETWYTFKDERKKNQRKKFKLNKNDDDDTTI